jgi:hypothetical protein
VISGKGRTSSAHGDAQTGIEGAKKMALTPDSTAIDAAVAENVMGWKVCTKAGEDCDGCDASVLRWADGTWEVHHPETEHEWSPSASMADAWEVVEKLAERGLLVEIYGHGKWSWDVTFDSCEGMAGAANSSSAPHGICIAALMAVGHP